MTGFNIILAFDLTLHALIRRKILTSKGQVDGLVCTTGLSTVEECAMNPIIGRRILRPLMVAGNP